MDSAGYNNHVGFLESVPVSEQREFSTLNGSQHVCIGGSHMSLGVISGRISMKVLQLHKKNVDGQEDMVAYVVACFHEREFRPIEIAVMFGENDYQRFIMKSECLAIPSGGFTTPFYNAFRDQEMEQDEFDNEGFSQI